MTQILEIIDKDFKEAIIKNAPRGKATLEMNGVNSSPQFPALIAGTMHRISYLGKLQGRETLQI